MINNRAVLLANAGIGVSYADFKYADPSPALPGGANFVVFSPDESAIAIGHTGSPPISIYAWSSFGFGAKYANPADFNVGSGAPQAIRFSPDGSYFAFLRPDSLSLWRWSAVTGFGARYDYNFAVGFGAYDVRFSRSSNHVFVAGSYGGAPEGPAGILAIPYSSSGFGAAVTPAAALAGTRASTLAVSPTGDYVVTGGIGIGVSAYQWTGSSFGSLSSISVGSNVGSIDFSPDGTVLAFGSTFSGTNIHNWSNGFGTLRSSINLGFITTVRFSNAGDKMLIGTSTVAMPPVYRLVAYRFGSRYRDPDVGPTVSVGSLRHSFSPSGDYIGICSSASPRIFVYKTTNQP